MQLQFNYYISAITLTPGAGPGGAGVGEMIQWIPLEDDESSEEDDVLDEDTPGCFGGRGVSSEELDEDTPGRFSGRGVSSEEDDEGVSSEGKEEDDEEPATRRNAHSAKPLSLGAIGQ